MSRLYSQLLDIVRKGLRMFLSNWMDVSKVVLLVAFCSILFIPILQMQKTIFELEPLDGAITKADNPIWSTESWFEQSYQNKFESFVNDSIGFRSTFVRFYNQIQFSLFSKANARYVVVGRDNYLFETKYIEAYYGDNFLGCDSIKASTKQIKKLQDTLSKMGKTFVVCIAPGKGHFYPDKIPSRFGEKTPQKTNYSEYLSQFTTNGINHLDFNAWLLSIRDTTTCVLYPRYGIHWSYFGMLLVADSITNYIEQDRGVKLPHYHLHEFTPTNEFRFSDNDIGDGLNLLYELPTNEMCYPHYTYLKDSSSVQPKTIVIADSFYWSMFNASMSRDILGLGSFWYYNKQLYPESYDSPLYVDDIDVKEKILESDVIMIMATETNLDNLGWGFVDDALKAL